MNTPTPEIRQAFYSALLAALPIGPIGTGDICWPNTGFRPDTRRTYIAPFLLFNETRTASLSPHGYEELNGIFQVTICGIAGAGEGEMDAIARELTDIYRAGTLLPLCGRQAITIRQAWRSALKFGGDPGSNAGRPAVVVSVAWHQYTQKGEE